MTTLLIARITLRDANKMQAYSAAAGPTLAAHGASLIGLGQFAGTLLGTAEDGASDSTLAIARFPSTEAAQAWYSSPEYSALAGLRAQAADMAFTLYEMAEEPQPAKALT